MVNKALMNVEETAKYLNIGKTKARELMKVNKNVFVVKIFWVSSKKYVGDTNN